MSTRHRDAAIAGRCLTNTVVMPAAVSCTVAASWMYVRGP
jgi:hypothetical protein